MRKILFIVNNAKAKILPGTKRAHALFSHHKKISYWSAAVLAMLVAPFAVQALVPVNTGGSESGSELFIEENATDVKSVADEPQSSRNSEVEVNTNAEASSSGNSDADVTINGQKVPVPKDGSIHKRMSSNGSETIVDVQIDNDSGSNSNSSSSTTIIIDSHSSNSSESNDERSGIGRATRR